MKLNLHVDLGVFLYLLVAMTGWTENQDPAPEHVSNASNIVVIELPNLPDGARPLRMVRIPAGSFEMGSPPTERGREETEGPVHTINIEYDFYMGETEVTQAQWIAVMGEIRRNDWGTGNDFPVYYISWVDIAAPRGFLEKINLLGQGKFRLPSEAEWEYACRAGTQTRFHFGDSLDCPDTEDCPAGGLPGNRSDYMWFRCKSREEGFLDQAHEVARLLPNQFGLFDMHGNVWEWCQDASHCNYEGAPTDGSAWENDQSGERMIRGGRWRNAVDGCRSAYRGAGGLFMMGKGGGFRLAMTP